MQDYLYTSIASIIIGSDNKSRKRESPVLVEAIFRQVETIFAQEPSVLNLSGDFTIVGDIHGNIKSLLRIFNKVGFPDNHRFVFLGDYVDRGKNSVDVLTLLFSLKCLFPDNIYMIRGNHECRSVNSNYGLFNECKTYYNMGVYEAANVCFDKLPVAAILNDRLFLVHGGISQKIHNRDDLFSIQKSDGEPNVDNPLIDFLWSDPSEQVSDYEDSYRGAGKLFSKDALDVFLEELNLVMVIRSHELCSDGYGLPFGDEGNIISIFSSVDYCGEKNAAGIVSFSEENPLNAKIEILPVKCRAESKLTLPQFIVDFKESEKIKLQMSDMQIHTSASFENALKMISVACV